MAIAGANHGMQEVSELEPEWTGESIHSLCMHSSNDETPYGIAADSNYTEPANTATQINWVIVHGDSEDYIINYNPATRGYIDNTHSPLLDGADTTINVQGLYSEVHSIYGIHFEFLLESTIIFNAIKDLL